MTDEEKEKEFDERRKWLLRDLKVTGNGEFENDTDEQIYNFLVGELIQPDKDYALLSYLLFRKENRGFLEGKQKEKERIKEKIRLKKPKPTDENFALVGTVVEEILNEIDKKERKK